MRMKLVLTEADGNSYEVDTVSININNTVYVKLTDYGEISFYTGERWTNDSCLKGYGDIFDKTKISDICLLQEGFDENSYYPYFA